MVLRQWFARAAAPKTLSGKGVLQGGAARWERGGEGRVKVRTEGASGEGKEGRGRERTIGRTWAGMQLRARAGGFPRRSETRRYWRSNPTHGRDAHATDGHLGPDFGKTLRKYPVTDGSSGRLSARSIPPQWWSRGRAESARVKSRFFVFPFDRGFCCPRGGSRPPERRMSRQSNRASRMKRVRLRVRLRFLDSG